MASRLGRLIALSALMFAATSWLGSSIAAAGAAPQSDFDVFDSQSVTTANVGDTITFSNTVANDGPDTGSASFTDTVTAQGQIVSFSVDQTDGPMTCQKTSSQVVSCDISHWPNNDIATLTVTVQAVAGGTLTNTAHVTSATDSDPDNDTATEEVTVTGASPTPTPTTTPSATTPPTTTTAPPSGGVQTGAGGAAGSAFPAVAIALFAVACAGGLLLLRRWSLHRD